MPANRLFCHVVLLLGIVLASGCSRRSSHDAVTDAGPVDRKGARAAPGSQRFDGVIIKALTFTGPQIAEALKRRAPEFEALTGAHVEVSLVPFNELYQVAMDDFAQKTGKYDLLVFAPQWMIDFVAAGYLEDLTGRIRADAGLAWSDIAPFFRDFSATYQGRIYAVPLDGDFQMVYYRADVLDREHLAPPETWEDYLAVAKAMHGKDLDGDGKPDFGSCISKRREAQAYWMVWSFASPFLQSQGTSQGAFFDPDTMKPLVHNPAFTRAIELYKATGDYAPPGELAMDVGEVRALFTAGRCALTLDWGDTGTLAIAADSRVVDKVGAVILPGSRSVLDRSSGKLVACDKTTCPYAIEGVNHAPYAAFGGWSGAISASAPERVKDATYAFLSYLGNPAQANRDVTIGASGFNPYRKSQFQDRKPWIEAGMSEQGAARYLAAIGVSLNSPNMVLDLRIPQNQRYQQIVLDHAIAEFLASKMSAEKAAEAIERGWDEITEELGRPRQQAAYRASLGLAR